jgi:hypothetical protein
MQKTQDKSKFFSRQACKQFKKQQLFVKIGKRMKLGIASGFALAMKTSYSFTTFNITLLLLSATTFTAYTPLGKAETSIEWTMDKFSAL